MLLFQRAELADQLDYSIQAMGDLNRIISMNETKGDDSVVTLARALFKRALLVVLFKPRMAVDDCAKAIALLKEHCTSSDYRADALGQGLAIYGRALSRLGRFEDALKAYRECAHLYETERFLIDDVDKYAEVLTNIGSCLSRMGPKRFEEALRVLNKAHELDPNNAVTLTARSSLLSYMQRKEEALADVDKMLLVKPGCVDFMRMRVTILLNLKCDEACSVCCRVSLFHSALESGSFACAGRTRGI